MDEVADVVLLGGVIGTAGVTMFGEEELLGTTVGFSSLDVC